MRSLQDYRDKYREIAQSLGYKGDSVELLVQLLANASYIEEVENIRYMEEASLDTAVLDNSKIQHCVDMMYSVFRGSCPRVLIKFKPNKAVSYNMYDPIITSSNFKVYYLGYLDPKLVTGRIESYKDIMVSKDFITNVVPGKEYIIVGLISTGTVVNDEDGVLINNTNKYYIDVEKDNLSNDAYIEVINSNEKKVITNSFSDHILDGKVFDLTLPGFGSRIYFHGISGIEPSSSLKATYFYFTTLDSFQSNELKKLTLQNASLVTFTDNDRKDDLGSELSSGLIFIPEVPKEDLGAIHYNANKDRYVNSIVRSNTDLGNLLVRECPEARSAVCEYSDDGRITIYYIPNNKANLISDTDKQNFINNKKAYYVTDELEITTATELKGVLDIDIILKGSDSSDKLETEIKKIISEYEYNFGAATYLGTEGGFKGHLQNIIMSSLSKLDNVRYVSNIAWSSDDIKEDDEEIKNLSHCYFTISLTINTSTL